MKILGLIMIVVGVALLFAGRITANSIPMDYDGQSDDGDFASLLRSVGKFIAAIGIMFIIAGVVCCFI